MAILKVRGLARYGILRDPAPYDLPLGAWSAGMNVKFNDGKVSRAPVFRTVYPFDEGHSLVHCVPHRTTGGFDGVACVTDFGAVYEIKNGLSTDRTPASWAYAQSSEAWTSTTLAGVTYLNRPDKTPIFYRGGDRYEYLQDHGWGSTWRCQSLRAFGDLLMAVNVTKGATEYQQMVKWSDFTQSGLPPGSWDETDTTKNAGENVLSNLTTPLVDGLPLRDAFIVYSEAETTLVRLIGGRLVLAFRTLFNDVGLVARNCVVEANNLHYLMTPDDIVAHDGVSWKSIIDGRNRRWLFDNLVLSERGKFFAAHSRRNSSILFGVKSVAPGLRWTGTQDCNLGAIYNYRDDTWTFMDLPNVRHACRANASQSETWESNDDTWEEAGGSWEGQDDGHARHLVLMSTADTANGFTKSRLIAWDNAEKGSTLSFPATAEINTAAWVERIGMDLDEAGIDTPGYKFVNRIYPQLQLISDPCEIRAGGSLVAASSVTYGPPKTMDPRTGYKIDLKAGGRYLAFRLDMPTLADFELTGLDLNMKIIGWR